jgi:PKD repeat protein
VFTDGSTDAGGRIVSWHWDFGDGGSSTDQSPAHIYASGTYTAALTVTDDRGQTATTSQRVTVGG